MVSNELDSVFRHASPLATSDAQPDAFESARKDGVDVLIYPSAIGTAPKLSDAVSASGSSHSSYVQDVLNVPASLAGLPAISVPAGQSAEDGMPVGVQIAGQWGDDDLVMRVAQAIEADREE